MKLELMRLLLVLVELMVQMVPTLKVLLLIIEAVELMVVLKYHSLKLENSSQM